MNIAIKSKKEVNYDLAFKSKTALIKIVMTDFNYSILEGKFVAKCTAYYNKPTMMAGELTDNYTAFDDWESHYDVAKTNGLFRMLGNSIEATEDFVSELSGLLKNALLMGVAKDKRYDLTINDLEIC
ncbi:hypothetical protein AAIP36_000308 [Flavobacterium psychrophilum]